MAKLTFAGKEFSVLAKEQKKTGGGPAPKKPSAFTAKVIDIFKETPFTGLEGFESTGKGLIPFFHFKPKSKYLLL